METIADVTLDTIYTVDVREQDGFLGGNPDEWMTLSKHFNRDAALEAFSVASYCHVYTGVRLVCHSVEINHLHKNDISGNVA